MNEIHKIADLIKEKDNIFVLTGAGISTESGIPDFRSPSGLYSRISPEVFEITFLRKNPLEFYRFHMELLRALRDAKPNPGHYLFSKLEELGKISLLATQNIDGLHQEAGSKKVAELHGNAFNFYCEKCGRHFSIDEVEEKVSMDGVPFCSCKGLIRPDVVLFGEPLKEEVLNLAYRKAMECDLFIACGTSLVVYPAAYLPILAIDRKVPFVIINNGETGLDSLCTIKIEEQIGKVALELMKLLAL